ncbi:hypothetical protein BSKO_00600 [Bryopsis sp. KO-2023]|nr:hypothetical protein BSKO_00600 [Bryopsis sp. KO-2023]
MADNGAETEYRMQASLTADVSMGSLPMGSVPLGIVAANQVQPNGVAGLRMTPLDIAAAGAGHHDPGMVSSSLGVDEHGSVRMMSVGLDMHGAAVHARDPASGALVVSRGAGSLQTAARKKPHLQGRFSGRLETKEDEKRLQEECRLLGQLVGGVGKRGEKSRMTLAKIVRAIASGEVRKHCQDREARIHEVEERMKTLEAYYQREITLLKQENAALRLKLEIRADELGARQIQGAPAHYGQESLAAFGNGLGLDVSSLPFLLPAAPNPSAAALQQGQVSGGPIQACQQTHGHIALPSMPHHTMVASMQANPNAEMHTKAMMTEEYQARAQMAHQVRQQPQDANLKRKLEDFKVAQAAEGMMGLKPGVGEEAVAGHAMEPAPQIGSKEETMESPAKTFHLAGDRKVSSSHVLKVHPVPPQQSSEMKPMISTAMPGRPPSSGNSPQQVAEREWGQPSS